MLISMNIEWVSGCCLTPWWAIFKLYHYENTLHFDEMMFSLYWTNTSSWIFIVLVHWNKSVGSTCRSIRFYAHGSWHYLRPIRSESPGTTNGHPLRGNVAVGETFSFDKEWIVQTTRYVSKCIIDVYVEQKEYLLHGWKTSTYFILHNWSNRPLGMYDY